MYIHNKFVNQKNAIKDIKERYNEATTPDKIVRESLLKQVAFELRIK